MTQKIYWCDQTFVLDPLTDLVAEKEVYGLLVLDAKEATMGMLRGKVLETVKKMESTVPSKTVKGGMCVSPDTLIHLGNGLIQRIDDFKLKENPVYTANLNEYVGEPSASSAIFKKKILKSLTIMTEAPSLFIRTTPEHRFFTYDENGVVEKCAAELKANDNLIAVKRINFKGVIPKFGHELLNFSGNERNQFFQLMGYILGDGSPDVNRITLFEADEEIILTYKKIAEKLFGIYVGKRFRKDKGYFEAKLYSKELLQAIKATFVGIFDEKRKIPQVVQSMQNRLLAPFIKGLYDAEGYVDSAGTVGITMSSRILIQTLQLLLLRFGIISSYGSDFYKHKYWKYRIRISDYDSLRKFSRLIGFGSKKKQKALLSILKNKSQTSYANQIPISGKLVLSLARKIGMNTERFPRVQDFFYDKKRQSFATFKKQVLHYIKEFSEKIEDKKLKEKSFEIIDFLEKIVNGDMITAKVAEVEEIYENEEFFDLEIPKNQNYIANCFVVHNSQSRYDGIREDALNEFFRKVAELAAEAFLKEKKMVGVIIGGPGPTKETFYRKKYLNYQIQNKIIGVKDIGYTGPEGLEELLQRSQDLLKEAAISKERDIMAKFYAELKAEGNIVYGYTETDKAIDAGAVEILLISEDFNWVHVKLKCSDGHEKHEDLPKTLAAVQKCEEDGKTMEVVEEQDLGDVLIEKAAKEGAKVEYISTSTPEGRQFKELGGIAAFLRYKLTPKE